MEDYIQERTENNAGLIYKADFYPIYTQRFGKWLCVEEMLILSFVYYWTKNWNYIYATNDDLVELTWTSQATVKRMLKKLIDLWYIEVITKTIVWMGTDRKMKFIWFSDGRLKMSSPLEWASEAESNGRLKMSSPKKDSSKAKSTGRLKMSSPWSKNKFLGTTLDNSGKCQKKGNPSDGSKWATYKNIYKENILFTEKNSDEFYPSKPEDIQSTKLDNTFMFDDGSIEYYAKLTLQQSSLEDITNILRPLFPHPRWYKGSKKDVTKALKQHTLDYDFVYGLIYDMKLLWFLCEYNLVRRPGFMWQRIDTYVPYTEKQRDEDLIRIVTYVKRNNQDKSLFEKRVAEIIKLCWLEKYRKVFRSIPANREDIVDLSHIK